MGGGGRGGGGETDGAELEDAEGFCEDVFRAFVEVEVGCFH